MINEILKLKKEKNAIILAHNYQPGEIQDIADFNGDSLELARKCTEVENDIIVFCGVTFMAETAKILNPEKKVLLPDLDAGCSMAEMAQAEEIKKYKDENPDAAVICYVNSTTEVKAVSDICVTSSNAVDIVRNTDAKKILFVPDKNLGSWCAKLVPEKSIELWPGHCCVHNDMTLEDMHEAKAKHPKAELIVHPECTSEVADFADKVLSTGQMRRYVATTDKREFIIGTEIGMLHRLSCDNPDKDFYPVNNSTICGSMKLITLEKLRDSLDLEKYEITVDEDVAHKAHQAIDQMLKMS